MWAITANNGSDTFFLVRMGVGEETYYWWTKSPATATAHESPELAADMLEDWKNSEKEISPIGDRDRYRIRLYNGCILEVVPL